jgi:hypothetical protein
MKESTVSSYIKQQDEEKGRLISMLVDIIEEAYPEAKGSIKWSQPVFETPEGPMIFIKAHKNHVNFGFWRGAEMDDPEGILEGTGVKMRHVKISTRDDIRPQYFKDLIYQAVDLNRKLGNPTR